MGVETSEDETYSAEEAKRRFEAALRAALNTGTKPLKDKPKVRPRKAADPGPGSGGVLFRRQPFRLFLSARRARAALKLSSGEPAALHRPQFLAHRLGDAGLLYLSSDFWTIRLVSKR